MCLFVCLSVCSLSGFIKCIYISVFPTLVSLFRRISHPSVVNYCHPAHHNPSPPPSSPPPPPFFFSFFFFSSSAVNALLLRLRYLEKEEEEEEEKEEEEEEINMQCTSSAALSVFNQLPMGSKADRPHAINKKN